jgi:ABC-type polysaccharide/polyol phosphate transport system ATPase subunit
MASFDVVVNNVSKRYRIRSAKTENRTNRSTFATVFSRREHIWALNNVSFRVERGEAVGIVGQNGAGKSTVLKLLSSITAPTKGEIAIRGRLSALVEVSSGFHPELTGRENIFLSGSILGMTRSEIARKVESIIEFSGVRRYIDAPVKQYSSGMYVRLGFSIAAHLEPDILILDEVLAVGDAAFQARCLERIASLRDSGKTILFTSHDLAALERLCHRALLLHRGELLLSASPRKVIDEYLDLTFAPGGTASSQVFESPQIAEFVSLEFLNPEGGSIRTGAPMSTQIVYRVNDFVENATICISLYWPSGWLCAQLTTASKLGALTLRPGEISVEFLCPILALQRGSYTVDVSIERDGELIDRRSRCAMLRVDPGAPALGDLYLDHSVRVLTTCNSAVQRQR